MGSSSFVWCLLAAVLLINQVEATESSFETCDGTGFGYELIQERLDQLQFSFMEVFVHIKELGELVVNNQRTIEQNQLQANQMSSLMVNYSKQILDIQMICANHDTIRKELLKMKPSPIANRTCHHQQESFKTTIKSSAEVIVDSCSKLNSTTSGMYNISVANFDQPVTVICEMQKHGGGWLVFQHRYDGSVNFQRNWTDYRDGFGTVGQEFWLGLEKVHQITSRGSWELMIELETFGGNITFARYAEFEIGGESEKYSLKKIAGYSGNAGDKISQHVGMKFSTLDSDNDLSSGNCAGSWKGGWWYNACSLANLNGQYMNAYSYLAIYWEGINTGLKVSRMMIRRK